MITFFTIPKPFRGANEVIQRTTITSWWKSLPGSQGIVFGDEPGIAAAAADLGTNWPINSCWRLAFIRQMMR